MTVGQRDAAIGFGIVLACALVGGWIFGVHRNPWVTLKKRLRRTGRRQRVFIDDEGRIEKGLPTKYRGIRLGELGQVNRAVRKMRKKATRARLVLAGGRRAERFRSKDVAVKALLDANPRLADFVQSEWGQSSQDYLAWIRHGRRGKKPQGALAYDGRLDALNYGHDLHGSRAVGSWLEALYATAPASGRWIDFGDRLPALEEATGLRLNLPAPAEQLHGRRGELEAFDDAADDEETAIYAGARRAAAGDELEDAPF